MRTNTGQNFKETKLNRLNFQCYYVVVGLAILAAVSLLAGTTISARAADTPTTPSTPAPVRTGPHYPPSPVLTPTTSLRKGVQAPRVTPGQPGSVDPSFKVGSGPNDRVVYEAVQSDGKILLGGDFTTYNENAVGRVARVNNDGSVDPSFNPSGSGANGRVSGIFLQNDGKILIVGGFTTYNGNPINQIARLNSDGTLDTSFNPGNVITKPFINAVAIQSDGKVLVAAFKPADFYTPAAYSFLRLNADGSLDPSFNPAGGLANGTGSYGVSGILLQNDGKILIGSGLHGSGFNYLTRLNPDGSLDPSFNPGGSGPNGEADPVARQSDGKIIIRGYFGSYNGVAISSLARINPDGTLDPSFHYDYATSCIQGVLVLVQNDDKLIIGTNVNCSSNPYISRLNPNGSVDTTFSTAGTGPISVDSRYRGDIYGLALDNNGKIVVGGSFVSFNGKGYKNFLRLNQDGSIDLSLNSSVTGPNGAVRAIAVQNDNKILVGGDFTNYNNSPANGIARLNPDGTRDTSFNPILGIPDYNASISAIKIQSDGKILVGGSNLTNNKIGIARLNPDGTRDTSFNPVVASYIYGGSIDAIVVQNDGKLLLSGDFVNEYGVKFIFLIRLNPDGTQDNSFSVTSIGKVYAVGLQSDGKIVAGGDTVINSQYLVRLNPDGTQDTSFNPTLQYFGIKTVAIQSDGKILVGGGYISSNGSMNSFLTRFNPNGGVDTTFNVNGSGPNNIVRVVTIQNDGKILAAGDFTTFNGITANGLVRLNPDGTVDTSFSVGSGPELGCCLGGIKAIALQQDRKILVGGLFDSIDTHTRNNLARLFDKTTSTVTVTSSLNPSRAIDSVTFTATLQPSTATGTVRFTFVNGTSATTVTSTVAGGVATYVATSLPVGNLAVTAAYSGDSLIASSSSVYTQIVNPGPPAKVIPIGGANQQTIINQVFSQPLTARVTDALDNPVSGVVVTFTAPASGPSLSFAGSGASYVGTTGPAGTVTTSSLTANATAGVYTVTASVAGVNSVANFTFINMAVCDSFTVRSQLDDGSCGTLRSALLVASNSQTSKTKTITLPFPAGTTLNLAFGLHLSNRVELVSSTSCGVGPNNFLLPPIILQGGSGDGLTLAGSNRLYGLWIKSFSGVQIKAPAGSHSVMQCVKASKN